MTKRTIIHCPQQKWSISHVDNNIILVYNFSSFGSRRKKQSPKKKTYENPNRYNS